MVLVSIMFRSGVCCVRVQVCVTGANGFVGAELVRQLLRRGVCVFGFGCGGVDASMM